ncbi:MerR family transcriptional regulator [Xylocopilactobacillus apis]|uniref:HTH-type transcriptional regulator GlnR n=1 Tax=Xylocopilactobacillus apis TaxID=2932183 RepID=A0AAU9DHW4_9LACO|nr:MerR family transcriptional regulator [Xylocopilactobacillus apis]BDR56322.1 HTH-type transcriptional regulator GlnR [Xylocopilactobacillus apis]
MSKEIKRDLPILSLKIVMALTDLTARQIRYYEEKKLISYHRSEGNQRMFSLNDIDELLIIKEMIDSGENIKDIQAYRQKKTSSYQNTTFKTVSDEEARDIFRNEMMRYLEIGNNPLD